MSNKWKVGLGLLTATLMLGFAAQARHGELPNRIPEAAPYNVSEAEFFPPPFEADWKGASNPGVCNSCHSRIFAEWNGSMMSNSWRDPGWRGAFLLIARLTVHGRQLRHPESAGRDARERGSTRSPTRDCTSTLQHRYDAHTTSGSGSLLDGFCSRATCRQTTSTTCRLANVTSDPPSGLEHGLVDPNFDPTSDNGTGPRLRHAGRPVPQHRPGQRGSSANPATPTPRRARRRTTTTRGPAREYPALGTAPLDRAGRHARPGSMRVADRRSRAWATPWAPASFRLSPHAIGDPECFGPADLERLLGERSIPT